MAEQKQTIVQPSKPANKPMGARNSENLKSIFSASPIHLGDLSDEERTDLYQELALDGEVLGGLGLNSFNRDYVNSPDLSEVETGGGGLPASPYMPNPTSPGPGSINASDKPEFNGSIPNMENNVEFGSGLGGTVSPSQTSENIASQTLSSYISGKSYEGSNGS